MGGLAPGQRSQTQETQELCVPAPTLLKELLIMVIQAFEVAQRYLLIVG